MNSKEELRIHRAKLKLKMLVNFQSPPVVEIPNIPENRQLFPGTKDDYWYKVDPDNDKVSACIYEMNNKGMFPTHVHLENDETCTLLTEGSNVEFITEEGIYEYSYPASFMVKRGMQHALINKSNFKIKLKVEWFPKMEGWNATFNENNNDTDEN